MSNKQQDIAKKSRQAAIRGPDPIGADLRRERPARRLATGSACVICGEADPVVLRSGRSVLEAHHIAGRKNDPDTTAVVCLNHHRKLTNAQRDVGVPLGEDPGRSALERLVAFLRGLGVFCEHLAHQLLETAHKLEALIRGLDRACPDWRALPEAG